MRSVVFHPLAQRAAIHILSESAFRPTECLGLFAGRAESELTVLTDIYTRTVIRLLLGVPIYRMPSPVSLEIGIA